MKVFRFLLDGDIYWGMERDGKVMRAKDFDLASIGDFGSGERLQLAELHLLAPVTPGKIIAVGRNYAAHAREMGNEPPGEPILFLKPPSAVLGPEGRIELPPASSRVDYEGELAIVIASRARRIRAAEWRGCVLGFTCANDVTARDLQRRDVQFTRGKSFDTFCPLGPWIETDLDPADLRLLTRINGEVRQDAKTSQMIFSPADLIEFISGIMTLEPGDVILTGTPAGVGPLRAGDTVEVEIEGIGTLRNHVVDEFSN